ncbi:hypothetical protein [Psychromonas sp. L1A2]|uniref:hypothetical protein n=1 Tax=Psychromonas sp. L1A2 TaxID=2686356 RepID=UPI001359A30F|nr:hypothetical protein [Psychromonas sp. L1A2]
MTIESLSSLQYKPKRITLWLSKQDCDEGELPLSIKRLVKRGLTISFVDEDIKSYKKLFYEYEEVKDDPSIQYIVTVDDDVYYPSWLTKKLAESMSEGVVTCLRARDIIFSNNSVMTYLSWPCINVNQKASFKSIAIGVSGIMYPKEALFSLEQQKNKFLELSPYADDLWFKCLTLHNGFSIQYLKSNFEHFPPVLSTSMKGLELQNVGDSLNDRQFQKCMKYFNLSEESFLAFNDNNKNG